MPAHESSSNMTKSHSDSEILYTNNDENKTHVSSVETPTNTDDSWLTKLYNWVFGYTPPQRRILCTGDWRTFDKIDKFQELLGRNVEVISQEKEAELQSFSAYEFMNEVGYFDDYESDNLILFVGAGRGSSQFSLRNMDGALIEIFMGSGYPKKGDPNYDELKEIGNRIFEKYGDNIKIIIGFDSIYHALKKTCPVLEDGGYLPDEIETTGIDFMDLNYLTSHYLNTPMLVVRNFKMPNNEECKITFCTGTDPMIDLGSGKVSLVDPCNGFQMKNIDLPEDWQTNDESLNQVVHSLNVLLQIE